MLRLALCDDDEKQLENLKNLIDSSYTEDYFKIRLFRSYGAFTAAVTKKEYIPDIAILDIVLGKENGISLAKVLNEACPECRIIFISSCIEFATDVYDVRHSNYVLKSQQEEKITQAINKVVSELEERCFVTYHQNGNPGSVLCSKVMYMERQLKKTYIYLNDGDEIVTTEKPAELFGQRELKFIKCHQSYYVNPDYIARLDKEWFVLTDGRKIPISRSQHAYAKKAFFAVVSSDMK